MNRRKDIERVEYYRLQASACALAAFATAIAEVKQAYLNLEEAWLCLASKSKENGESPLTDAEAWSGATAEAASIPEKDAVADGYCRNTSRARHLADVVSRDGRSGAGCVHHAIRSH